MVRILRKMIGAVRGFPLAIKFLIGIALVLDFVLVTQWDWLVAEIHPILNTKEASVSSVKADRTFDFPNMPRVKETPMEEKQRLIIKRKAQIVIEQPIVNSDGSISGDDRTLFLYGIKPFNLKDVCTRASGERWACGLHAYATLRNNVARRTIICEPKAILPKGISALCHVGTIDIAAFLARQGLVEVDTEITGDPDLPKAQAYAKDLRLGVWDR